MKTTVKNEKRVTSISAETEIHARKELVWGALQNIGAIERFHPLVKKSKSLTEKKGGLGAVRSCELLPMGVMQEQVVDWQEGRSFEMEVIGGKMLPPHTFMKGVIALQEQGLSTDVKFTLTYQLKFGILGSLMDALMIRPQFRKGPPKYIDGLKAFVENSIS